MPSEALSIGDTAASWAKSTGSNNHVNQVGSLNERSSTTGKTVGMSKSSSPSVGNCDKLHLTPRQKQLCVQGGDGLAETLFEGFIILSIYYSIIVTLIIEFTFYIRLELIEIRAHFKALLLE